MELSFVIAALKRRIWVVLIFVQLGAMPFIIGTNPASEATAYESEALIEVLPPDGARTSAAQPDRYVLTQMEILRSRELAGEVVDRLGTEEDPGPIIRSTTITQIIDTDAVSVQVRLGDPTEAQRVAQTIADVYIERLRAVDDATREPDIERINTDIALLRVQLEEVNQRVVDIMAPYLNSVQDNGGSLPPQSIVAPNETAEQTFLTAEIQRLEAQRSVLENESSGINTSIVQRATLPVNPVQEATGIFNIAFLIGMSLMGVTVALIWARLSPKLLDEVHATEVLGIPVVSKIKRSGALKTDPLVAFNRLPQDLIASVDQIAVQAEALAEIDRPLTIAVVGSQRGAGTTTTAVALAARFAAAEYSVLVVDADRRDPWITDVFTSGDHGGLPALIGQSPVGVDKIFSRTSEPDVRVLGFAGNGAALRRETVPLLVDRTREAAQVIIFDGGPLLDAASSVELTNVVDAVVLAVPLSAARVDDLTIVTRQLSGVAGRVLPVLTGPTGGTAGRQPVSSNLGADSRGLNAELVTAARGADDSAVPPRRTRGNGSGPSGSSGSDRLETSKKEAASSSLAEAVAAPSETPRPAKPKRASARTTQSRAETGASDAKAK